MVVLCANGALVRGKDTGPRGNTGIPDRQEVATNLGINAEQREQLNVKLGIVTPLIERLATIT